MISLLGQDAGDGYERLCRLVRMRFGINLSAQSRALLTNRLGRQMNALGLANFEALAEHVERDGSGQALDDLAGLIATNHTYFFREPAHFAFLRTVVLPELADSLARQGGRDLRFWCAAASTGEEAYSFAMTVMEFFGGRYGGYDAGLLATDLSLRALGLAADGVYTAEQAARLPPDLRRRYFLSGANGDFRVQPTLRSEVLFRKFNLVADPFAFKKPFHVVFCRNVMIYFDEPTCKRLIADLYKAIAPGGYLFIGHCETLPSASSGFEAVSPAVFRRLEAGRAPAR